MSHRKPPTKLHSPATKKLKASAHEDSIVVMKAVNTIRVLVADVVQEVMTGHPGAAMGCAPIAFELYSKSMNYNPSNPKWPGRDRFVLSNGHACLLHYIMLHLTGYDISIEDLKRHRRLDSKTPGHPSNVITPGIEITTGPLGQGIANGVGLAIAERHMASTFNKNDFEIVDNYTFVLCGDGCMQEGISSEASSLAGHLGLGKLIVIYDDNQITIDGSTSLTFSEDVIARYRSYGWHTSTVQDGTDIHAIHLKIEAAKVVIEKPSLIRVKTIIGYGSMNQGSEKTHGYALGEEDVRYIKEKFDFDPDEKFVVPDEVAKLFREAGEAGKAKEAEWDDLFKRYNAVYHDDAEEFIRRSNHQLPQGWKDSVLSMSHRSSAIVDSSSNKATRVWGGVVLNKIAENIPEVIGGSADLTSSNYTQLNCSIDFEKDTHEGRYLRFGVREHAMAGISNGIFAYGGIRPFCATFLVFMSYSMGAIRLSALSRFGVIYIMTHDSVWLGEDGPTHQPIEIIHHLRSMPNLNLFRPADINEVKGSYIHAMESVEMPSVICLSRQPMPQLEGTDVNAVYKGAYTLSEHGSNEQNVPTDIILLGTGSELHICVETAKVLALDGRKVRVVSMPCMNLFDCQSLDYQLEVFPEGIPVMSVEASSTYGWHKYAHAPFGIIRYGSSASCSDLRTKFGFTPENLNIQAQRVMEFYPPGKAPSLVKCPKFDMVGYDQFGY